MIRYAVDGWTLRRAVGIGRTVLPRSAKRTVHVSSAPGEDDIEDGRPIRHVGYQSL
jgi:hypothetical protein